MGKKTFVFVVLLFLLLLPSFSLFSQSGASAGSRRGDAITLKIAVMGSGNQVYFWFGHIGLVAEDRITGQTRFFDWGVFSFENENFFSNFAFGRLLYSCMVSPADSNYSVYIRNNRSITLYTLDLPAEKKEEVLALIGNSTKSIRFELAQRTRHQLRRIPELSFFLDDSLDYIENIDRLLGLNSVNE